MNGVQFMRNRILFYLNGQRVEVAGDDAFLTLSDYLRRRRGLTGTKVVCAEGDCGSCTVLVGRPESGKLEYKAVASCIQILFQLDASHVVTVEGLRQDQKLNPIQQAMVACHGTQCGFCTPGFVVALHGLMSDGLPLDAERVRRGLTGNLCRCTGYDSIIKAAMSVDRAGVKSLESLYQSATLYSELLAASVEPVRIETADLRFYKPISLQAASQYRVEHPGCSVIAGGTDLGVVHNKRIREIKVAMSLSGLPSLCESQISSDAIHIGAGCTLAKLQSLAQEHLPELGRFMDWFGSPLIRNAGTVGGNLVTGSPIGDTIPAMIALGAEIELTGLSGVRSVPVGTFYTGYRQTVLADDELVTAVKIPLLKAGQLLRLYKVSRRKDLDISSLGAAIWIERSGQIITQIRLAFGGVGPTVMRLPETEAVLRGQPATLENFERAAEVARLEVKPISDVRGSAEYRRTLAGNILLKFWHETMPGGCV
jgi:xanthine dehydrogenase small subunit